jgi:tetratricopeptide (TPR) repeat protein
MPEPGASPDPSHTRGFRVAALLLSPFLFFLVAEAGLAIVGFGGRPHLFVDAANVPGYLEPNSQVMRRYFPEREARLGIDPIVFKKQKAPDTKRVIVQGGSTAAGFPFGRWAGLAGMLGDRLEATHPYSDIEVVSTAMAAVNSYTLLDFVDEIIEVEPDAVLIYAGHNEYVGIFGAGSALTAQRSRTATQLHLQLSRFRVYQLVSTLLSSVARSRAESSSPAPNARDTLMAQAASSPEVPIGSPIYKDGLLQFESNLSEILARYQGAGIPVYIATLASNERDQSPFVGGVVDESIAAEFQALMNASQGAYQAGRLDEARELAKQALELASEAANVWFLLGRIEEAAGRIDIARSAYEAAKDLDRLRFRAPVVFNQTIRKLAEEFGATVVDVRANMLLRSPKRLIGKELMLEHLHPNARGYFLLADAFYRVLDREQFFGPAQVDWSYADAYRDMPITGIDRVLAAHAVREIRNDYPFRPDRIEVPFPEPENEVMTIAKRIYEDPSVWLAGMESLLQYYIGRDQTAEAAVVARMTAQALPWEAAPNIAAAKLLLKLGRMRQAARYFERGLDVGTTEPATLVLLARIYLRLGENTSADKMVTRLRDLDPNHAALEKLDARMRVRQTTILRNKPTNKPGGHSGEGAVQ